MDQPIEGSSKRLRTFDLENGEIGASISDLRDSSKKWSLDGDIKLLGRLKELSNSLVEKAESTEQSIKNITYESDMRRIDVSNVINEFQMLSSTQFVESRVYDEEVDEVLKEVNQVEASPPPKTKEQKEAEVVPKIRHAVEVSCKLTAPALEFIKTYDNCDSDEEDDGNFWSNKVPLDIPWKSHILNRPLPHLIGSEEYVRDDFARTGSVDEVEAEKVDAYDDRFSDEEDDDEIFEAQEAVPNVISERDESQEPLLNNFAQPNESLAKPKAPKPGLFDDLLSKSEDEDDFLFSTKPKQRDPVQDSRIAQPETSNSQAPSAPLLSAPSFQEELSKAIKRKANIVNEQHSDETSPLISSTSKASTPSRGSTKEPTHSNNIPDMPSRPDSLLSNNRSKTSNIFAEDSNSEDEFFTIGSKIKPESTSTPKAPKSVPQANKFSSLFDSEANEEDDDLFSQSKLSIQGKSMPPKVSTVKNKQAAGYESGQSSNSINTNRPPDIAPQRNSTRVSKALFDDSDSDDDSIFGKRIQSSANTSQTSQSGLLSSSKSNVPQNVIGKNMTNEIDSTSRASTNIIRSNPPPKAARSLFMDSEDDDDDGGLFKSTTTNSAKEKPKQENIKPHNHVEPTVKKIAQNTPGPDIPSPTLSQPMPSQITTKQNRSRENSRSEYVSDQEDSDDSDLFKPSQKPSPSSTMVPPLKSDSGANLAINPPSVNENGALLESNGKNAAADAKTKINKFGSAQARGVPVLRDELAAVLGRRFKVSTDDSSEDTKDPVPEADIEKEGSNENSLDDNLFKPMSPKKQSEILSTTPITVATIDQNLDSVKNDIVSPLDNNYSRDKVKLGAGRKRRPPTRKQRDSSTSVQKEPLSNGFIEAISENNSERNADDSSAIKASNQLQNKPPEKSASIRPSLDLAREDISKLNMVRSPSTEEEDLLPSDVLSGQRQTFSPLGRTPKSLFDDEDEDLFTRKNSTQEVAKKEIPKEISPAQKPLETSITSTSLAPKSIDPPFKKNLSLFSDDDDEDIFAPKSSSKSDAQINNVTSISNQVVNSTKPPSKSLFSDDDDDIFGNFKAKKNQGSNEKSSYAPARTKYTTKSLFDDDDEDDEDLFSSSRPRK